MTNSKKNAGKKNGWTEGQTLIHQTFPAMAEGPIKRAYCKLLKATARA